MLSNKERQELLEKHQQAQFRNRLRLMLSGSAMAFASLVAMIVEADPEQQQAFLLIMILGLLAALIGVLD